MTNICLKNAQTDDIDLILQYLSKFHLDSENIFPEQFIIAEFNGKFAGFARIKPYRNIYELASVGVLEEYRNKGIGNKLVKYLLSIFPFDEIWVTTKIADYFKKFGFETVENPPEELLQKSKKSCANYRKPEEGIHYMRLKKNV